MCGIGGFLINENSNNYIIKKNILELMSIPLIDRI